MELGHAQFGGGANQEYLASISRIGNLHHQDYAQRVLLQLLQVMFSLGDPSIGGVAFWAHIGGFVSQGYLNTSENNYLVSRSVNGTAEFTDAAIFFSATQLRSAFKFGSTFKLGEVFCNHFASWTHAK